MRAAVLLTIGGAERVILCSVTAGAVCCGFLRARPEGGGSVSAEMAPG
jgi:hypothetical protein